MTYVDEKLDYQNTTIYNQLASILVKDSIATIQKDILKIIGFEILDKMASTLLLMRKMGTQILYTENIDEKKIHLINSYDIDTNNNITININNSKSTKLNINDNRLLIFGDAYNNDVGMLKLNNKQKQLLFMYDEIFTNMYKLNETISLWFFKVKDLQDKARNPLEQTGLKSVVNNLLNRKSKNLTIIDKEDDLSLLQATITNTMINEAKEKIATVFGIPFSKLFKGTSSGFNNLDKNDIDNWNFEIRFFQLKYIIPNIKKIYNLLGKSNEFEAINIEPIDYENKQIDVNLQTQEIENIIKLKSMNLITKEKASELLKNLI